MRIRVSNFDVEQIANSGQCFRMIPMGDGSYRIIAFSRLLSISQENDEIIVSCSQDEWKNIWADYFDMETDYSKIGERILASGDEYLINAYRYGSGIRILRQDLWETIVSFMISQNNNIPRIKGSVEKICLAGGIKLTHTVSGLDDFSEVYAFPMPGQIDPDVFMDKRLGLGYRSEYIRDLFLYAENNPGWTEHIKSLPYEKAMDELMEIKGIGRKVANCICLFSLHHVEAFPIDTHIKKIIATNYPNGFDTKKFPHVAGIIQQYMFYYDLR